MVDNVSKNNDTLLGNEDEYSIAKPDNRILTIGLSFYLVIK